MTETVDNKALAAAFEEARNADAPINVRLALYAEALRRHHIVFAEAVDRLVGRLQQAGAGAGAPQVGEAMPPFLLPDDQGRLVGLEELLARGPTAIAFHRGYWCPYCRISASVLGEVEERARAVGGQIVAITPEMQHFSRILKANAGATLTFLSDISNGYAVSLNLAIWVGEELKRVMRDFGRDLAQSQGNDSWILPIPATFIVAQSGLITARCVDPDYRRRMDADDLIAGLQAARR